MQSHTGRSGEHLADRLPSLLLAEPPHGLMADMKEAGYVPECMAVGYCSMHKLVSEFPGERGLCP